METIKQKLGFDLPGLGRAFGRRRCFAWGLLAVLLIYLSVAWLLKLPLTARSAHDAYTLQALHWRQGLVHLPQGAEYDWLELAIYNGSYFVSFPPFPTVPMLLLSFLTDFTMPAVLTGYHVPSTLVNLCMYLVSYALGYALARRAGYEDATGAALAAFLVAGCNLLIIALYGGVWNIAQGMCFLLMMLFLWGMQKGSRGSMAAGLICLACAVGCRPFQAAYVPLGLVLLYQRLRRPGEGLGKTLGRMVPYLIAPALIALAYALYNHLRFGSPIEFGHTYLPEFQAAEHGQLSTAYLLKNLRNILRWPTFMDNQVQFPTAYGFAFYLVNPLFLIFAGRYVIAAVKKRLDAADFVLLLCAGLHFFLLLLHKSFGAWQFGTRYLVDLLPVLFYFVVKEKAPLRFYEGALMLWGIIFNAYGTVLFVSL